MEKNWKWINKYFNFNIYKSYKNYTVGILKINGCYRYRIDGNIRPWHFKTIDEAKRGSFEYILKRLSWCVDNCIKRVYNRIKD